MSRPTTGPRPGSVARRAGTLRAGLVGAAVLALAACAGSTGGSSAVADPTGTHPVVVPRQAQTVLVRVTAEVTAAGKAANAAALGPRLVGPERDLVAAALKLPANLRSAGPSTDVAWKRLLVPAQTGWPRWFAAVGSGTARPTPVIWVLSAQTPRSPYGLWGELDMLPGAQLPETATADQGAPVLAPDADGLVATPRAVATDYADLLTAGTGSRYARLFGPDVLRDQVLKKAAGDRAKLQAVQGKVTAQHALQGDPVAVRTADGGALVIARLTETYTVKLPDGAGAVKVGDPVVAALAGRSSFTTQVVQTSAELVAFVVPPASSGGQIQVVAAAKAHLSATGS